MEDALKQYTLEAAARHDDRAELETQYKNKIAGLSDGDRYRLARRLTERMSGEQVRAELAYRYVQDCKALDNDSLARRLVDTFSPTTVEFELTVGIPE